MAQEQASVHNIILENQEKMSISGVIDVDTFDEGRIVLLTEHDTLIVEGESLHIQKLDVVSGELVIEGAIYAMEYTGGTTSKASKGFFKKMLK